MRMTLKSTGIAVIHEVDISTAGKATFLCGGVSFASCDTLESVCSTLRLMPATLDSGETCGDVGLDCPSCDGGGVDRIDRNPCSGTVTG
jgi:hypothetical protein